MPTSVRVAFGTMTALAALLLLIAGATWFGRDALADAMVGSGGGAASPSPRAPPSPPVSLRTAHVGALAEARIVTVPCDVATDAPDVETAHAATTSAVTAPTAGAGDEEGRP